MKGLVKHTLLTKQYQKILGEKPNNFGLSKDVGYSSPETWLVNKSVEKKGWLFDLLHREGIIDGSKRSRKESCWSYYKSQQLYIEAVQEAKDDCNFDPRRSEHVTGKDGRFMQISKGTTKPKNALTVTYMCFAFAVPYATFKRWKADAFVSKTFVPAHKGKSILTDKMWASQIFNPRKMFLLHEMEAWLNKHPAQMKCTKGKKVC